MGKYMIFSLLFIIQCFGQDAQEEFLLKPSIHFGTMFSGLSSWPFPATYIGEKAIYPINPNLYFGVAIATKDLLNIADAKLNLLLEFSYGFAKTKKLQLAGSSADMKINNLPIVLWVRLKSGERISPFVQLGAGLEQHEFKQTYYDKNEFNVDLIKWFFCYGIGAGIKFNFFEKLGFAIFVETVVKEHGFNFIILEPRYQRINYDFRNGDVFTGLNFEYSL